jgi:1-acyl-sn-glycerol-3-phosphate acyltransferase
MRTLFTPIKPAADLILTLLFWTYFTLGYILFFSPFYAWSALFSENREKAFQKLNHFFYKGFFLLMRMTTPGLSFHIQDQVTAIRSSIIICNHVSYLDPIFLISLFEQQKTIVKSTFFKVPIFGWVLKKSGYLPSASGGAFNAMMIEQIEGMGPYLASGGNLFVFPEGSRSRDGQVAPFNKGVFKIAARCRAPIKVLYIRNTNRLFCPGKFLFNTCVPTMISVEMIKDISPDYENSPSAVSEIMDRARTLMEMKHKEKDS